MKYALTLIFIVQLVASCSSQNGITKARAYVREKIAGTIPVDNNGRPLRSGVSEEHLLFVECISASPAPVFRTAWVKQKPYTVQPTQMSVPAPIGKTITGEDVVLTPKPGHTLWQLVLTPKDGENKPDPSITKKHFQKEVVLTGTWKGKNFVYTLDKEQRLEPLQFQ